MSLLNFIYKYRAAYENDLKPIDNVLFHIRCRGLKKIQTRHLYLQVLINWFFTLVIKVVTFPIAVARDYKNVLISLLLSLIPYAVFELIEFNNFLLLLVIIWLLLNIKIVVKNIYLIAFDIGDVFSGMFITRNFIDI